MIMRTVDDDYWEGPQCPVCGFEFNCEGCKAEEAYNEYLDERIARLGIVGGVRLARRDGLATTRPGNRRSPSLR